MISDATYILIGKVAVAFTFCFMVVALALAAWYGLLAAIYEVYLWFSLRGRCTKCGNKGQHKMDCTGARA